MKAFDPDQEILLSQAPSNEDLLALYQAADFAAFDLFYQRNNKLIYHFLLSRLGNQADADEAFQETFLRLHRALVRYDPAQSALGWVMTIARNAAIDILRRRHRTQLRPGEAFDALPAPGISMETVLAARQALLGLLQGLSTAEQALLSARFIREESYEQLADKRGENAAQIRQRLSRLVRRLRG